MSASSIRQHLLHRGLRARVPLFSIPSRQTIDGCVCNGLMSTELGKLIGTKLSFQMNQASICGTMMAAFVLDAMLVNAAFQSVLSNGIVAGVIIPGVMVWVQHKQLLPLPAYSPDMSPIEHVWDLVDWCFARHACPEASKDELLLRIQTIWSSLPQANIQNRFESMPRRIAALIAMSGGYTKY
ncbi:UNVERIFIED_CONTAM: Transposable element Tcb2 transposase [Trichonephila clavipes]